MCGGFPCQPFSKAGFQKGFDDDRGNLFFVMCKIIKKHRPKYLFLENVKNLTSHDNGNTWRVISQSLTFLGYRTYQDPVVLNAMHFGVPQNRERVIIMAKRQDMGPLPTLPPLSKRPKSENLLDFLVKGEQPNLSPKMQAVESVWNEFLALGLPTIPKFPIWTEWWGMAASENPEMYAKYTKWIDQNHEFYKTNIKKLRPWLVKSRKNTHWMGAVRKLEWQAGDFREGDSMNTVLWTARGSGIRVKRPNYIPTLVAISHVPVYGPESRTLSPRELLRLQSFPDSFEYEKDNKNIFKQVGNAVNVKMIEQCARFLILDKMLLEY
jgi:DNA (cytosine-5)-methyltransferase 1